MCHNVLEANVRVDNQGAAKDGVHNWVKGATCERRDGQRDETSGNDAAQI